MLAPTDPPPGGAAVLREHLVEQIDGGALELPLMPETASQVLEACNSDRSDARQLSELVERDPSMASHVLRVANSAAYAPEEPIVSLRQAVSRLGFVSMYNIALSIVVEGEVFNVEGHESRLRDLWVHSATTAAWAKEIARMRRTNVEGAFLAGLLHDVGRPVVLQTAVALEGAFGIELPDDALVEWMEEFHEVVGASLLESWGLPEWIVATVGHHHSPRLSPGRVDEARTICLADELAHWSVGTDDPPTESLRQGDLLEGLGIYSDELDELFAKRELVQEIAGVFT